MSVLKEIQAWYSSQCDDQWEHQYGIEIGTIDNPGWSLEVDLTQTHLSDVPFGEVRREDSEHVWFHCRVENDKFLGFGGPQNLENLLETFLNWAKTDKGWLQPPTYETLEDENQQFWESLSNDIEGERCKVDGCENDRIQYSVLCRRHHFERYKQ